MKPVLVVDKIQKYYGNRGNITKAVDNISFSVEHGEFVGVMGPSGSGKTTLLNIMGLMLKPTDGQVYIEGVEQKKPVVTFLSMILILQH